MDNKSMGIKSRASSFGYALNGLWLLLKNEPNAKLHVIAAVVVVAAGVVRHIGPLQWLAIAFAMGLVFIAETINTAIERLCDFACDNQIHPAIKIIKDISAAAVLIAALVSIATGVIVFFF